MRTLWRYLWGPVLASVALVLLDSPAARAEPGVPVPPNGLLTDRAAGDVSAADRDFVVKVRLAGLWEIPAGDMAQKQSDDPRIQQIGKSISTQHVALDQLVRTAAKKLKITLPAKPNADQQSWLAEMRDARGTDFDQIYVDRLRAAHGKIFPAIATIRSSTRNDTVRKLAQQANQFVMTHLTLLESSGIVDYQGLPAAPPPTTAAATEPPVLSAATTTTQSTRALVPIVLVALVGGLATGILVTRQMAGSRRRATRQRRERYYGS